ncbi:MAG TPA: hypothetical protein PKN32_14750, partial [Bacteroidales bacterium]|nr:hypothetical protein [Bacteroidales bacterium]
MNKKYQPTSLKYHKDTFYDGDNLLFLRPPNKNVIIDYSKGQSYNRYLDELLAILQGGGILERYALNGHGVIAVLSLCCQGKACIHCVLARILVKTTLEIACFFQGNRKTRYCCYNFLCFLNDYKTQSAHHARHFAFWNVEGILLQIEYK